MKEASALLDLLRQSCSFEAENMEDYINGTDNSSQDDETDEQQSFFAPALTDNALNY